MGFYIEVPERFDKARQLERLHGAQSFIGGSFNDVPDGMTLVCVVTNPHLFDAAAIVYDQAEYEAFTDPTDARPKQWRLLPTEKAVGLSPDYRAWLDRQGAA